MKDKFDKAIQIQENQRLCIINMPIAYREELLASLPEGATSTSLPTGKFDTIILFTNTENELSLAWERLFSRLIGGGAFWIFYPNKKSNTYNEISKDFMTTFSKEKKIKAISATSVLPDWKAVKIINPA
jgi:hypothetical protein